MAWVLRHLQEQRLSGDDSGFRADRAERAAAVFERAEDPAVSRTLDAIEHHALSPEHHDVQEAFRILGLSWSTT